MSVIIYKITSPDEREIYVGSTRLSLANRKSLHKSHYRTPNKRYCLSFTLFERYGFDACIFSLLEQTTTEDRYIRERYWIESIGTLGQKRAYITDEERIVMKRTATQRWRDNHKEHESAYREEHKEELSRKYKEWYGRNKQRIQCECGGYYMMAHKRHHLKTAIHKKSLSNQ